MLTKERKRQHNQAHSGASHQQSHGASSAAEAAGGEEMSEFFLKIGKLVVSLSVGPQDSADRLNYKISQFLFFVIFRTSEFCVRFLRASRKIRLFRCSSCIADHGQCGAYFATLRLQANSGSYRVENKLNYEKFSFYAYGKF